MGKESSTKNKKRFDDSIYAGRMEPHSSSHRVNLNDLLRKNKAAEKLERKKFFLTISAVVLFCGISILIISF